MELPARKSLDHRGPVSLDISISPEPKASLRSKWLQGCAWYFITICADGHAPWVVDES